MTGGGVAGVSHLDVSGVSLQHGQTQHQEEELLAEGALLHDARVCVCVRASVRGAPEPAEGERE